MPLVEQLSLEGARIVALCGAGGKTSLLYALGRAWATRGRRVALTTSTHIRQAVPDGCCLWNRADEGDLLSIWRAGLIPVAGRPVGEKLKEPSEEMWAILRNTAERLVVEADGAAMRPVKYPAVWEPAIPQYTDRVLVLAGLTALGRPLREVCHRADLALEKGVVPDRPLTEAGLAALLLRGYGRYDPLFVLNQADDEALLARGEAVASLLRDQGYECAVLSMKDMGMTF